MACSGEDNESFGRLSPDPAQHAASDSSSPRTTITVSNGSSSVSVAGDSKKWTSKEVQRMLDMNDPRLVLHDPSSRMDKDKYNNCKVMKFEGNLIPFILCMDCTHVLKKTSGQAFAKHSCQTKKKREGDKADIPAVFKKQKAKAPKPELRKKIRKTIQDRMLEMGVSFRKTSSRALASLLMDISRYTVENKTVIDFTKLMPHRTTLSAMASDGLIGMKLSLRDLLKSTDVTSVTVTCDHWQDFAGKHNYLGVTAQFMITSKKHAGTTIHALLALKEAHSHSSEDLVHDYNEVISYYGIAEKVNFVVTDGAETNKCAFRAKDNNARLIEALLEADNDGFDDDVYEEPAEGEDDAQDEEHKPVMPSPEACSGSPLGRMWVWCTAHLIQAASNWSMRNSDSDSFVALMEKCRSVVSRMRRRKAARLLEVTLKRPISIRWDSQIMMAESIKRNIVSLKDAAAELKKSNDKGDRLLAIDILEIVADHHIQQLEHFIKLMSKISEIRIELSGDSYPTMPLYISAKKRILLHLDSYQKDPESHPSLKHFAKVMSQRIDNYMKIEPWHAAAAILYPCVSAGRTKCLLDMDNKTHSKEKSLYDRGMDLISELYKKFTADASAETVSISSFNDGLDFLPEMTASQGKNDEIGRYISLCGDVKRDKVAQWLVETAKTCPIMSRIACIFMGPATSVKAESIFSQCGYRLGKRSQCMNARTLEAIMMRICNEKLVNSKIILCNDDGDGDEDPVEV